MLHTSRGAFREAQVLIEALPRYVRSRFISQDDLFAGRWRDALEAVLVQPDPPEHLDATGAEAAAHWIRSLMPAGRVASRSGAF